MHGCKLRWRSLATMMALATEIIVALLWLREPTTGVHSFGGGSSIHQPVQFPVKLSQLLTYSGDEVSALTVAPD